MMVPDDDPGDDEFEGEEKENAGHQDLHTEMPHRGLRAGALQHLVDAMGYGMVLMYIGHKLSMVPLTDHTPSKHERNRQIRARCIKGETVVELAQAFGISQQRVSQILRGQRK